LKLVESKETKKSYSKRQQSGVREAGKIGFMTKETILDNLLLFPDSEE